MSYETLLADEVKQSEYLAVFKPRKRLSGFSVFSGSVYSVDFDLSEYVSNIFVRGIALTRGTSSSLSAGQFYYNNTEKVLYVRLGDSSNPNSSFVVCEFEIYTGTFEAHWHRDPLDTASEVVYFEPIIDNEPGIKASSSDILSGYMPTQTTSVTLINTEQYFEKILHDTSFNKCPMTLYHWLSKDGELSVANLKKVMNGVCSKPSYTTFQVTIEIRDRVDLLDTEWRNYDENFYSTDLFPDINPQFVGRPIRYVFGRVEGLAPVNVSYVDQGQTTSDNREHAVISEVVGVGEKTYTVLASPASTATRTYLNSVSGLRPSDTVLLPANSVVITSVGSNYIEHETITPLTTGQLVKRGFVSRIDIYQSGIKYTALYGRDYTCTNFLLSQNVAGIVFDSALESNLSMPATLSTSDTISCTVYGPTNFVTRNAAPFGSNNATFGNLTNPAVILWEILKNKIGSSEEFLDDASFADLESFATMSVGISIPSKSTENFPKIKDLIISILQSILTTLYVNNDLNWAVFPLSPLSTSDFQVTSDEIIGKSFRVSYEYDDIISDTIVSYSQREIPFDEGSNILDSQVSFHSDTAEFLHGVQKQKTVKTLLIEEDAAFDVAEVMSAYFGDRSAKYSFQTIESLYGVVISDRVSVVRDKLPGFEFVEGQTNERILAITSIQKTLDSIQVELSDQKGFEEI